MIWKCFGSAVWESLSPMRLDVKAAADCVAWSNDKEGVAHWIEKNILAAGT